MILTDTEARMTWDEFKALPTHPNVAVPDDEFLRFWLIPSIVQPSRRLLVERIPPVAVRLRHVVIVAGKTGRLVGGDVQGFVPDRGLTFYRTEGSTSLFPFPSDYTPG